MSTTDTGKTAADGAEEATAPAPAKRHVGVSADGELGAAGSQLSTAPVETVVPGSFGGVRKPGAAGWLAWTGREITGWARWFWRQLTSMRVALLLLFMLSLGAIPGSLIPQSGTDAVKVQDFKDAHSVLGTVYDKLGLFHVYSSVWFSAIYILLFVSLIGCIVPRTWQFVGQLRSRPPGAPKRLNRLPAYATWRTDAEPEQVREVALKVLKKRRFRAHIDGNAVAAEKGYLRETGNLLFHLALIVMLIAFAWGQLFKSEGNKLIVEGDGFSNTLLSYDDFKSGNLFSTDDLTPFSFDLKKFTGTYEETGPNKGTPAPTRRTSPTAWAPTARSRRPRSRSTSRWRSATRRSTWSATATRPSSPSGTARARSSTPSPCRCCRSTRTSPRRVRSRSWTATGTARARRNSSASPRSSCRPSRVPARATCSPSSPRSRTPCSR